MSFIQKKRISNENYTKIAVVESMYTLFLFLYVNKWEQENVLFVLGSQIYDEKIFLKFDNIIVINDYNKSLSELRVREIVYKITKFKGEMKELYDVFSGDIPIFGHDHLWFSFLYENKIECVIEDGTGNYTTPEEYNSRFRKFFLLACKLLFIKTHHRFGFSNNVSKVILTGQRDIPFEIKGKTQLINISDVIKCSTKKIEYLFNIKLDDYCGQCLVLTQPLSEDLIMDEDAKLKLYKELVMEFINKNYKVLLKLHPRDRSNYTAIIKEANVDILPSFIPIEFFFDISSEIKIIASVCSTSSFNLKKIDNSLKIYMKGSIHDKRLVEKYHSIEPINEL